MIPPFHGLGYLLYVLSYLQLSLLFSEVILHPPATTLEKTLFCPCLKMPPQQLIVIVNYHSISNVLFLGKVVEEMMGLQLQRTVMDIDYLDS